MKLTVASSPHIRGNFRTNRIMLDVVIALMPALAVGIYRFGLRALWVVIVSIAAANGAEWLYSAITRSRNTIVDCSATVTGLLLAMTLPATVPLWQAATGSVFAIIVIKALCGGLGQNIFNPALSGRALLMLIFPASIVRYQTLASVGGADIVTAATPLHHMAMNSLPGESLTDMLLGNCPGAIGEICSLALLIGGAYLIWRRVISIRIPAAYLITLAAISFLFPKAGSNLEWMLYNLLGGGAMLGAIFMATDYVTSPVTAKGQVIFGIGCGALTALFRYFGIYPEGVTYAILIMNAAVWIIDRHTAPRRFGVKKGGRA